MTESHWTPLDHDITYALTCQVHVLSHEQIERIWSVDHSRTEIARSLHRLCHSQLIRTSQWDVVAPPVQDGPVFVWRPGEASPDAFRLSFAIRQRWHQPDTSHTVYQATKWAAQLFGSRAGKTSRRFEQCHDLLLGEVFTVYRRELPELACCWVGEDALPIAERGVKNPDAFLLDHDFIPRRVVESAGAYSQSQVESFHRYCVQARLPYELW